MSAMRSTVQHLFASVLLGVGVLTLLSPLGLAWLIHGDQARYLWLISGPAPFNELGSGPVQLWTSLGLVLVGAVIMGVGVVLDLKRRLPR